MTDERSPWWWAGAGTLAVAAGLLWPEVAGSLLRVGLVAAAAGGVVVVAGRLLRPMAGARDPRSPFDRLRTTRVPAEAPAGLRRLEASLEVADAGRTRSGDVIPFAIEGRVRSEASRRLYRDHGLDLGKPADHERVRALISPALWSLIGPDPRPVRRGRPVGPARRVPIDHLPRILDDLEQL